MLSVAHLHKRYGTRVAVADASFEIPTGSTVGLLGPNGAGKTTTLGMISGLTTPDGGSVMFEGTAPGGHAGALKARIGLVPQDLALYEELSAWANLELFGALYGLSGHLLAQRAADALQLVGLADRRRDRVASFSGGMKRRLNIASALLHDPDLVLLDEPTVGVDPQSRNAIFENLEELKRRGKTLLYTTHYMEEAERLCDRIVIMDHGRVIADDTVDGLRRNLPAGQMATLTLADTPVTGSVLASLAALPRISAATVTATGVRLATDDFGPALTGACELLAAQGCRITGIHTGAVSLEEVFIALTGRDLRDDRHPGAPS
jgi:ABC-2 type transport system ATP-binding protein